MDLLWLFRRMFLYVGNIHQRSCRFTCPFVLPPHLPGKTLKPQSLQMCTYQTPTLGMLSCTETFTQLARFMPPEMHPLMSIKHSSLPRDCCACSVISAVFQGGYSDSPLFSNSYSTSSTLTFSNKSRQHIVEKTEGRREFPQFLPSI